MRTKHLLVVTGPTASGKTGWCVDLARHYGTEVISADSKQFYREMEIGTAKPDAEQLEAAPHHFVNSLSVTQPYNAGRYEEDCLALLNRLFRNHDVVILCGGSGLYIDAVLYGLDALPPADDSLRRELAALPLESLKEQLNRLDPDYYREADLDNPQRLIRAIEVCRISGIPYSQQRTERRAARPFRFTIAGIDIERTVLYDRIDKRVDDMISRGLEAEARKLLPYRDREALRTIGYTEMFRHFDGECSLRDAIEAIKKNTRNYAKRQQTWWRRNSSIRWFKPHEYNALVSFTESVTSNIS